MEKPNVTRASRDVIPPFAGFPLLSDPTPRSLRSPAPIDRERAKAACAPMGALSTVVVTQDAQQRRRTWYVIDPDPALAEQYAAHGLELVEGCKVLIDADAMRPVALIDLDPASNEKEMPAPCGFNPYWDLPPT